jgi:hypothetical protein
MQLGVELDENEVPIEARQELLQKAIDAEIRNRAYERDHGVFAYGTAAVFAAAGAAISGAEVFRSNSNWLKAVWAVGSMVCGAFTAAGVGLSVDFIHNDAPETKEPTERIKHLQDLKNQITSFN